MVGVFLSLVVVKWVALVPRRQSRGGAQCFGRLKSLVDVSIYAAQGSFRYFRNLLEGCQILRETHRLPGWRIILAEQPPPISVGVVRPLSAEGGFVVRGAHDPVAGHPALALPSVLFSAHGFSFHGPV